MQLKPHPIFAGRKYQGGVKAVLLTLICMCIFIKLGLWQYHKAQDALRKRASYDAYVMAPAVAWPSKVSDFSDWEYRTVHMRGHYLADYLFFLDNQFDQGRPGFHIYVPMQISNSEQFILVNLGWHPANPEHTILPTITLPKTEIVFNGRVTLPSKRHFDIRRFAIFSEQNQASKRWQAVRQFLDLHEISRFLPQALQPVVIQALDMPGIETAQMIVTPKLERHWPAPADRVATNLGYAYQWFGFAIATFLIFLAVNFKRQQPKVGHVA